MLEVYAIVLAGVALAQVSPGPNLVAVAGAALSQGLSTALYLTLGIATATLVWVASTALGLAAFLIAFPSAMTALKLAGGSYLCFIAFKALRGAVQGKEAALASGDGGLRPATAWLRGFLINMSNPKSALTWAAVATLMLGSGLSTAQVLGFAPIGAASAMAVYSVYALLFSRGFAKRAYARFAHVLQGCFGLAFGALGARLVLDGIGEAIRSSD